MAYSGPRVRDLEPGKPRNITIENILIKWIKDRQEIDNCPSTYEASQKLETNVKQKIIGLRNGKYMRRRGSR